MLSISPADLTSSNTPDYHWSPANQRRFLEALSTSGNISESAKAVSMSGQAAYAFCNRAAGRVFRLGWDAAVLVARRRVEGELLERALAGQEETYERDPDTGRVTRTRVHNGLSMAMLTRLDRMALGKSDVPADIAMAQIVAQDFERFLDIVEAGGGGAEAMLFLKARDGGLVPMAGFDAAEFAKHYQLAQNNAVFGEAETTEEEPELTPEEEAAAMKMWLCDHSNSWRTNFPPPEDFYGDEDGIFGDIHYDRELSEEEENVRLAWLEAEVAPVREAGEAARKAYFGLPEKADDFTQRHGDAEAGSSQTTITCHPRAHGGPWPEAACENEPSDGPGVQAMDFRVRGNDKEERMSGVIEREVTDTISADLCASARNQSDNAETDKVEGEGTTSPSPPPEDPNIRVIHCEPPFNYAAHGMIPPWAERIY